MEQAPAPVVNKLRLDLEDRLLRYRSRLAAEGRTAAVKFIDRAIDEERRKAAGKASSAAE